MRRFIALLFVASATFVPIGRAGASTLQTVPDCDAVVLTYGDSPFDAADQSFQAAVERLRSNDIDLHLWVVPTIKQADDLAWKNAMVSECPNWREGDDLAARTFVMLVTFEGPRGERPLGARWGYDLRSQLSDSYWYATRDNYLIPNLREGDFTRAMTESLNHFSDIIEGVDDSFVPTPDTDSLGNEAGGVDSGGVSVQWARILSWLGAGLALIVAVAASVLGIRRYLAIKAVRAEAARDFEEARTSYFDAATLQDQLHQRIVVRLGKLEASEAASLVDIERAALAQMSEVTPRIDEFDSRIKQRRSGDDWSTFGDEVERFRADVAGTKSAFGDLQIRLDELDKWEAELPALLDDLDAQVPKVVAAIKRQSDAGFRVDYPQRVLDDGRAILQQAREKLSSNAFGAACQSVMECRLVLQKATEEADGLPKRYADLQTWIDDLQDELKLNVAAQQTVSQTLHRLVEEYNLDSLTSVRGNDVMASDNNAQSAKLLDLATRLSDMKQQDWDGAEGACRQAETLIDSTKSMLEATTALDVKLRNAHTQAPGTLRELTQNAQAALSYVDQHRGDINTGVDRSLREVEGRISQLETELSREKPEYLSVLDELASISQAIESAQQSAERQHQNMVHAASVAKSAIDEAASYISRNSGIVESSARSQLDTARTEYSNGQNARGPEEKLAYFQRAANDAQSAESSARSDVAAEEARLRRIEEERRRREDEERRRKQREEDDRRSTSVVASIVSSNDSGSSSPGDSGGGGGSW